MARTALTQNAWAPNSNLTDAVSGGTAIGIAIDSTLVTNGATIAPGVSPEHVVLRVTNTSVADKTVTVRAGNRFQSASGDLVTTVVAGIGIQEIGPFASARFLQQDGSMSIDFATGLTGWITAKKFPRGA